MLIKDIQQLVPVCKQTTKSRQIAQTRKAWRSRKKQELLRIHQKRLDRFNSYISCGRYVSGREVNWDLATKELEKHTLALLAGHASINSDPAFEASACNFDFLAKFEVFDG